MTTYTGGHAATTLPPASRVRVTIARSFLLGPLPGDMATLAADVYERLAGSGIVYPATRPSAAPADQVVTFDVRTTGTRAIALADVVAAVERLIGARGDVRNVTVVELGRTGRGGTSDETAAGIAIEQQRQDAAARADTWTARVTTAASATATTVRNVLLVAGLIIGLVAVGVLGQQLRNPLAK